MPAFEFDWDCYSRALNSRTCTAPRKLRPYLWWEWANRRVGGSCVPDFRGHQDRDFPVPIASLPGPAARR